MTKLANKPVVETALGRLYETDCLAMLDAVEPETVDLAFADPPFNLGKKYSSGIDDAMADREYIEWCQRWLSEMIVSLKPGGSLFLWNLPKWNLQLGGFINERLTFRNWISVDIRCSFPIRGRLYPSHYSLLYFVKGSKPAIFHPDRLPMECCRHCGGEIHDYGGHRSKMNQNGVGLTDVWKDISPVRHAKYRHRGSNALPLKLMDRIVSMASDPGSLVLDPFGGSGATYVVAEITGRRWLGSELDCKDAIDRFKDLENDRKHLMQIQKNKNVLFTDRDTKRHRRI